MTDHPITPPPERFKQWEDDILNERDNVDHVLDCAWKDGFLAGADQELEACCEYIGGEGKWFDNPWHRLAELRAARRPKPPSPKEEALRVLENLIETRRIVDPEYQALRHALEALPND